jgi:hypothetical protein
VALRRAKAVFGFATSRVWRARRRRTPRSRLRCAQAAAAFGFTPSRT